MANWGKGSRAPQPENKVARITFDLEVNGNWAANQVETEIADYIRQRLDSSLGFRGAVSRFEMQFVEKQQTVAEAAES